MHVPGPEYLEDQLAGGPSHEPRATHRAHVEPTIGLSFVGTSIRFDPVGRNKASFSGDLDNGLGAIGAWNEG